MTTENTDSTVTPFKRDRATRADEIRESIPGAFLSAIEYRNIRLSAVLGVLHCIQQTLESCAGNDRDSADPDITRSSDALDVVIAEVRSVHEGLTPFALSREAASYDVG
jgi:hypothetical protein